MSAGRWQRRKDVRPSEITAAALDLFVDRGFAATRLDDIAERAGVSKGTLYLYFKSKEDLFKSVILEGIVPAIAKGEALVPQFEHDPKQLLIEIMLGWWRLIGATPLGGVPKLMMAEARNFPEICQFYFDEVITRGRRLLLGALELGMKQGVFRRIDPEIHLHLLMSPLVMMAAWRHSFSPCEPREVDPERYLSAYIDLVLNGLLQTPEAAQRKPPKGKRR